METRHAYRELDMIPMPEPIPELGVQAGEKGTVHDVYDGGRKVFAEVSRDDGTTIGFVDLALHPEPRVISYSATRKNSGVE